MRDHPSPTRDESRRPHEWWSAPLLSFVLPGAGHLLIGHRRRAAVFGVPFLVVVAIGLVTAARGAVGIAELLVRPSTLWAVFGMNVLLLVVRVGAVVDTSRSTRDRRPAGIGPASAVAAIAAVAVLPHLVVGAYSLEGIDLLQDVFGGGGGNSVTEGDLRAEGFTDDDFGPTPPPRSTTMPSTTTTTTLPPPPVTVRPNIPADQAKLLIPESDRNPVRPVIVPDEPAYYDAPFEPFEDRFAGDRITVLLAGGDAGPGRSGLRTDVMMVATFDPGTGEAAIFGLPRNLARVPLPEWMARSFEDLEDRFWEAELEALLAEKPDAGDEDEPTTTTTEPPQPERCECFADLLNALYVHTRTWINTFPDAVDPGMEALRIVTERLLGLPIDYYVLVDFGGFVDVIDALGGVDVMVAEAMNVGFSPAKEGEDPVRVNVEPGLNHLDGRQALAYVRDRTGSSDYVRMTRQRCMLAAMADRADPLNLARSFPSLSAAIKSSTTTNIPLNVLPDLVRAVAALDGGSIATVAFQPPFYTPERDFRGAPIPDPGRIRATVASVLSEGVQGVRDGAPECP